MERNAERMTDEVQVLQLALRCEIVPHTLPLFPNQSFLHCNFKTTNKPTTCLNGVLKIYCT